MFTQIGMGQSVGESDLQPGDLVFFANTFRPGLSHAGVYVGGGQFVHAENESTGVVQSDLFSDYYGSRWYGGTRIGGEVAQTAPTGASGGEGRAGGQSRPARRGEGKRGPGRSGGPFTRCSCLFVGPFPSS